MDGDRLATCVDTGKFLPQRTQMLTTTKLDRNIEKIQNRASSTFGSAGC